QRGHHVYLTGCSVQGQPNSIQLSRPFRETIRLSLIQTGIPEDDAESLARDSGRSLVVLRRLVPAAPGTVQPDWARVDNARTLVPALLAGGWDESTNGDREILEQLSGQKYDQWIANLIYEQPAFGDVEYTFEHALSQEVAYGSVLQERRAAIERRSLALI